MTSLLGLLGVIGLCFIVLKEERPDELSSILVKIVEEFRWRQRRKGMWDTDASSSL